MLIQKSGYMINFGKIFSQNITGSFTGTNSNLFLFRELFYTENFKDRKKRHMKRSLTSLT